MGIVCPECGGSGFVHKALYEPTLYTQAVQSGDHRKWSAQNKPATSSHKDSTQCRVCYSKGHLG